MSQFKLFVWRDVLQEYTSGMAVAFAATEEEARQAIMAAATIKETAEYANFTSSPSIVEGQLRQIKEDIARSPDEVHEQTAAAYCWGGG